MSKGIATIVKERDVRIHATLWSASRWLLTKGTQQEEASFYQFMASLVFTAFTLEAYLNFLGDKMFRHWEYLESLSPKKKLALISEQLNVTVDDGKRPWQTVGRLFDFRNDIAHGKPEFMFTNTPVVVDERLDRKVGAVDRTEWEKFSTRENAERAREDIQQILTILHDAAKLPDGLGPLSPGLQSSGAMFHPPLNTDEDVSDG